MRHVLPVELDGLVTARADGPAADVVARLVDRLRAGLAGRSAAAVLWFASAAYDPQLLAGPLAAAFDGVPVVGCSSAGEFTADGAGTGSVAAVALPAGVVVRAAAALADLPAATRDPAGPAAGAGTDAAVAALEAGLGAPLRDLDPRRHVVLALVDGLNGLEDEVCARLAQAAPGLDVVGGSAADDLRFESTWVAVGDRVSRRGAALLVLRTGVPFGVLRTCAFAPTGHRLTVTRTDPSGRVVHEFDHLPAVEAYADAVGIETESVDPTVFARHPVGPVVDGRPWLRSPAAVVGATSIAFRVPLPVGTVVEVADARDLVATTRDAVREVVEALGGASGAVLFDCVLRRATARAEGVGAQYAAVAGGLPVAGFDGYGQTRTRRAEQSLTGLVLGRAGT